jgi:hypothetical protein
LASAPILVSRIKLTIYFSPSSCERLSRFERSLIGEMGVSEVYEIQTDETKRDKGEGMKEKRWGRRDRGETDEGEEPKDQRKDKKEDARQREAIEGGPIR